MSSAFAVVAVRLGLRIVLSTARRPSIPIRDSSGRVSRAAATARNGPATITAATKSTAPTPTSAALGPANRPSRPSTASAVDQVPRVRVRELASTAASRSAWMGSVRAALRAGMLTDSTVMTVPSSTPLSTLADGELRPAARQRDVEQREHPGQDVDEQQARRRRRARTRRCR